MLDGKTGNLVDTFLRIFFVVNRNSPVAPPAAALGPADLLRRK